METSTRLVGATIYTGTGTIIDNGELAFEGATITYVGPRRSSNRTPTTHAANRTHPTSGYPTTSDQPHPATSVIDMSGHILMPGLINTHTHSAMTLMRGINDDCALHAWLNDVQGLESKLTIRDIQAGLNLAMAEMLRSGTTAFADMYYWNSELISSVSRAGMRIVAGPALFNSDAIPFSRISTWTSREWVSRTRDVADEFRDDPLVQLRYGVHAIYSCRPDMVEFVAEAARNSGLGVHIHLSETAKEVQDSLDEFGETPIALAARLGLLGERTLVAHGVHVTPRDIEILAETGASLAHNPMSNLKLGSGIAPLPELLAGGVNVGLGTDGTASNNSLNMFEEIKAAAVLHRGVRQQADAVSSSRAIELATTNGARALGISSVGSLEVGKDADVVVVSTAGVHAAPAHSPASFLAFSAQPSDVTDVFVRGRALMRAGELTTIDEAAAIARVNEVRATL
ncbi:amidohydrolase [Arcanobacterium haemolyticum]|nr:amidohydrolase [Arcanobacterium haemolyticum]